MPAIAAQVAGADGPGSRLRRRGRAGRAGRRGLAGHLPTALIVLAAALVAPAILAAGPASAAACGGAVAAGSNCTMTGTVTVTGGTLTLTSPAQLSWSTTLTGTNQSVVDVTPGDQQFTVDDATGTGAGWHVTASATTFTSGRHTLPNTRHVDLPLTVECGPAPG